MVRQMREQHSWLYVQPEPRGAQLPASVDSSGRVEVADWGAHTGAGGVVAAIGGAANEPPSAIPSSNTILLNMHLSFGSRGAPHHADRVVACNGEMHAQKKTCTFCAARSSIGWSHVRLSR
jgi:hypothetical protein